MNIKKLLEIIGNKLLDIASEELPSDMDPEFEPIFYKCKDYTMTSKERMYALYNAIKYVSEYNIEGDIVECGVWKGGSSMISALTLNRMEKSEKKIYMYDTYSGMSEPTKKDIDYEGNESIPKWKKLKKDNLNEWDYAPLKEVQKNMFSTGYPKENIFFIKGKVEDTIPNTIPNKISLLRLDTDWYESTYHELIHLFPLLSEGGVIIIDDYGHWKGAKEAVDEYFHENSIQILLNRVDYTGRIGIKL